MELARSTWRRQGGKRRSAGRAAYGPHALQVAWRRWVGVAGGGADSQPGSCGASLIENGLACRRIFYTLRGSGEGGRGLFKGDVSWPGSRWRLERRV